jgi:hypothetical protein
MEDNNAQPQAENLTASPQAERPVNEEVKPASAATEQQPKTEPTSFELEVKYNKASQKLTKEQAIEYAQKGMNYDKVLGELEGLKNDPAVQLVLKTAKEYGVPTTDLAEKWGKDLEAQIVNEYAEEHDVTPEKAKQELKGSVELKAIKDEVAALKSRFAVDDDVKAFFDKHPDVATDKIPQEVLDAYKEAHDNGKAVTLNELYKDYEYTAKDAKIAELEKQLNIKKVNDTNAGSSMPAVTGAPDGDEEFTEEQIKNMPRDVRQAKMPKILAWMHGKKT